MRETKRRKMFDTAFNGDCGAQQTILRSALNRNRGPNSPGTQFQPIELVGRTQWCC